VEGLQDLAIIVARDLESPAKTCEQPRALCYGIGIQALAKCDRYPSLISALEFRMVSVVDPSDLTAVSGFEDN